MGAPTFLFAIAVMFCVTRGLDLYTPAPEPVFPAVQPDAPVPVSVPTPTPQPPTGNAAGGRCSGESDCGWGLVCRRTYCRRVVGKGDACGNRDRSVWCDESFLACRSQVCVERVPAGRECSRRERCVPGFMCLRVSKGQHPLCVAKAKLNEVCGGRGGRRCNFPYICSGSRYRRGSCKRGVEAGGSCDMWRGDKCARGLRCEDGTCKTRQHRHRKIKKGAVGSRCRRISHCETGLVCAHRRCRASPYA